MEKKEAAEAKKLSDASTKEQMTEAKDTIKTLKEEMKAKQPPPLVAPKASLAQAEPELSKEDQEEADRAKESNEEDAILAKSQKSLKESITADEKNKVDMDAAKRDGGSEGLEPTIAKAEKDNEDAIKK